MFRALAVAVVVSILLALVILGPEWLMSSSGEDRTGKTATCDLLEQTCKWEVASGHWQATLARQTQGGQDELLALRVQGPGDHSRLVAVMTGHSMYLGEYPVPLQKAPDDGVWRASFTPPYCSVDPTMTWRIELMVQRDRVIETPFDLVFTASGKG